MDATKLSNIPVDEDGIDRRQFLSCMAWAGSGLILSMNGGVLRSFGLTDLLREGPAGKTARALAAASFNFAQISDSHIGFSKEANPDVIGTLKAAVEQINAANAKPALLIHTGDLSHLSKDEEFDAMDQVLKGIKTSEMHFVPGEHDVLNENGKNFLERYAKKGKGWCSFDHKGVHFVALVNVLNLKAGGMGNLGQEQLAWLADDLRGRSKSTPIVVFAHVPLWTVYAEWGWGTDDSAQALALLKDFGSVTVLNGHIHQAMQKIEGNVVFHTARSTAFPQPGPGKAAGPGPMKVPPGQLQTLLGTTSVGFVEGNHRLAIVDSALASAETDAQVVAIDNFAFSPATATGKKGPAVKWVNHDDIPHKIVEVDGKFSSPALDTGDSWEHTFAEAGEVRYFCSLHAHMKGKVVVH
ncbi:MAG TPA: metallophosphoesterase [Fimbriimonadaceae bacterium]|nr:metallophosphoesterase [Fimbriimonadaceae bacterium]